LGFISKLVKKTVVTTAAAAGAYWFVQKVWAFRDPERVPDMTGNTVISPADGMIMFIKPVKKGLVLDPDSEEGLDLSEITKVDSKADGWLIGIYVSPLDVRYNYSPIEGTVTSLTHTKNGGNTTVLEVPEIMETVVLRHGFDIFHRASHFLNERNTFVIEGKDMSVTVVQISDVDEDAVKPLAYEGETVEVSQRIGFMDNGAQVDIFIPKTELEFKTDVGAQVYGAQSVIATY